MCKNKDKCGNRCTCKNDNILGQWHGTGTNIFIKNSIPTGNSFNNISLLVELINNNLYKFTLTPIIGGAIIIAYGQRVNNIINIIDITNSNLRPMPDVQTDYTYINSIGTFELVRNKLIHQFQGSYSYTDSTYIKNLTLASKYIFKKSH